MSRKGGTAKQTSPIRQPVGAKPSAAGTAAQKRKDDAMASIISGLNVLIAQASGADMGMASRILYTAKEELVHWAVDMNFYECSKDRYVNRHLYESGLHAIGEFIARLSEVKDDHFKGEVIRMLGASMMSIPNAVQKEEPDK